MGVLMRALLVVPLVLGLPGCIFVRGHTWGPGGDDSGDVTVDSSVPETGGVRDCEPAVRDALRRLPGATVKACDQTWIATTVDPGPSELTLQLYVDTSGRAPDGSVVAPTPGTTFTIDLATAAPHDGFLRLSVGAGQFDNACGGPPAPDPWNVWLGVEGQLTVTLLGGAEPLPDGSLPPDGTSSVRVTAFGVVVQDRSGGSCRIPELTFSNIPVGG